MTTNRNMVEGPTRRALEPRIGPRSPGLAWLGLAMFGLLQTGCKSDGCSKCGLGNAFSNGVQAVGTSLENGARAVGSIFHHKKGCGGGDGCGCGGGSAGGASYEEGVIVDQGIPVVPGAMAIPAPGTIVSPPPIDSEPTQLKPLDPPQASPTSGSTSKPTTTRSSPSGASRPGYTTGLPRSNAIAGKSADADQSLSKSSNRSVDTSSGGLLENIPPVDLPSEVTRKAVNTPAPVPAPAPAAPNAAENSSAADGGTVTLPPINASAASQAPGLRRFASIAPAVAGGSAPTIEGLDWLKEKGYRTLLDLRKSSEVDPAFADAVNDRGMVYISLPIMATRLDPSRLARFDDLVSRTDDRPLFFCDADGTRAALAWYIHERVVGHENPQAALSKIEDLGLGADEVKLAEDYLATHKPKVKSASNRVAMASGLAAPEPRPAVEAGSSPTSSVVSPPALPEIPDSAGRPIPEPALPRPFEEPSPAMLPGESRPQASRSGSADFRDPSAWKPVAALLLTSVGVPLAFWSRSIFSDYRHERKRASLPGSQRRSLDAPVGLDA